MVSLKYLRLRIGKSLPLIVVRPLYELAIVSAKTLTRCVFVRGSAEIWTRHSYQLGYWQPFASDIDLTVWTSEAPSSIHVQRWIRGYRILKKLIPILGEVNFYWHNGLYAQYINSFELAKDPILLQKWQRSSQELPFEKAVFLLKTFESNAEEIFQKNSYQILREKKWSHFKKSLGLEGDLKKSCLQYLKNNLSLDESAQKNLDEYFEFISQGQPHWSFHSNDALKTLFLNRFCYRTDAEYFKQEKYLPFLEVQLRWEIWGLSSQLPYAFMDKALKGSMKIHINNLLNLLRQDERLDQNNEIKGSLTKLSETLSQN